MNALGIIFADSFDSYLGEIISKRTLAAVPFGGRYRLIDFLLSNLVNADVRNIGIVMTQNYYSLMNHVRAGASWDLDRKASAVTFLPPFAQGQGEKLLENRLEYLQANLSYIRHSKEKYVFISNSNYLGNIDLKKLLDHHIASGADITGTYTELQEEGTFELPFGIYEIDHRGRVIDVVSTYEGVHGMNAAAGLYVMEREFLVKEIERTIHEKKKKFSQDILVPACRDGRVAAYKPSEPVMFFNGLSGYLKSNLRLLDADMREALFGIDERPVVTKVKDSAPTRYGKEAVATNSLIADGAVIEGEVHDSIIFRGVHIKKGAVVENSVIMQDTVVGEDARLNYVVLDKNVVINSERMLAGYITHPFYVSHRTVI